MFTMSTKPNRSFLLLLVLLLNCITIALPNSGISLFNICILSFRSNVILKLQTSYRFLSNFKYSVISLDTIPDSYSVYNINYSTMNLIVFSIHQKKLIKFAKLHLRYYYYYYHHHHFNSYHTIMVISYCKWQFGWLRTYIIDRVFMSLTLYFISICLNVTQPIQ